MEAEEKVKVLVTQSFLTLCDPMNCSPPSSFVHRILQARTLQRMSSHSLLQGIFLTQGSNPGLLHCRQILYHLRHQGNPLPILFFFFSIGYPKVMCIFASPLPCIQLKKKKEWINLLHSRICLEKGYIT